MRAQCVPSQLDMRESRENSVYPISPVAWMGAEGQISREGNARHYIYTKIIYKNSKFKKIIPQNWAQNPKPSPGLAMGKAHRRG